MEKTKNDLLVERLAKYPELRERMEQILGIVENSQADANTADEAEERAVEEVRKLGQEILGAWAVQKEQKLEKEYDRRRNYRRKGKKSRMAESVWADRSRGASLSSQVEWEASATVWAGSGSYTLSS